MARTSKEKPYNNGQWTVARFHSFVKGALRAASSRWGPKYNVLRNARTGRGVYTCAGYGRGTHGVAASIGPRGRKQKNVFVDHILPVIGTEGFTNWDSVVERMFVEADGLQILCKECHDKKTKIERQQRYDAQE